MVDSKNDGHQPTVWKLEGSQPTQSRVRRRLSSGKEYGRRGRPLWPQRFHGGGRRHGCSQLDGNGSQIKRTVLHDLYEKEGQSPWYDNLCRPVTDLLPLISSGVRGVTSNPAIFQKAISTSNAYNEQFRELIEAGKDIESAYWELVVRDIQDACKLFEPIYDQTDAGDGYVSVEVSPRLADDTEGTVEAAKWLHKVLIFSLARYEAVIDAYLDGLEDSGLNDLSRVTSVASFFVSRVDTLADKMLEKIGTPEALDLRGKAANAQAALAYKLYQKKFSGPRWEALVKKGAKKQRLLWASTSVKNPAYPDTLYVAPLIGPDTVSTMPDQALQAFIDHGIVSRTIDSNVYEAEGIYNALEKLGIEWGYVGSQLEVEGVDSFKKSFESLLDSLQEKANSLKLVSLSWGQDGEHSSVKMVFAGISLLVVVEMGIPSHPSPSVDWDGYTIGYYGRIFEARNKTKGGSFEGDDKDFYKFRIGYQQVIPAFEEAISGMALGGIRRARGPWILCCETKD
ncbi:hypothetical protein HYC85_006229 [Camellia sinensis]|uniref:Rotamase n=1 Tax=Camellia sinensis TaxID=4442 RepID=A0A7J7HKK5_CAMSI|nr:hypothetical protein HYC85_006229 [Camellia sinensis]